MSKTVSSLSKETEAHLREKLTLVRQMRAAPELMAELSRAASRLYDAADKLHSRGDVTEAARFRHYADEHRAALSKLQGSGT